MPQDLPPRKPEPLSLPIPHQRRIPQRTLPSWVIFSGAVAFIVYGIWRLQKRSWIVRELKREEMQTQFLMKPIIQAEQDKQMIRKRIEILRLIQERGLDVDLKFYNNPRYEDASIPLF